MLEGGGSRLHATAHAGALTELQRAGLTRLPAELTAAWVALADDRKYSRDVGAYSLNAAATCCETARLTLQHVAASACRRHWFDCCCQARRWSESGCW